jgi:hypothetical protein
MSIRPAHLNTLNSRISERIICILVRCHARGIVSAMFSADAHCSTFGKLARRAGELAEYEHARIVIARRDEFFRDEIHSVMKTAHKAQLRGAIVLVHFGRLVMLNEKNYCRMNSFRESRVDSRHQRANPLLIGLIILDARPRGRSASPA